MTPLERAARALSARTISPNGWKDFIDDARAVLLAIREPSEGMTVQMAEAVEAATEIAAEAGCERPARLQALAAQAAFIDAALSEKPE